MSQQYVNISIFLSQPNYKQILGKVKSDISFYPARQELSDEAEAEGRVGYTWQDG